MSNRAWSGYLALTFVAVAGYFLVPADTWAQTIYAELVGLVRPGRSWSEWSGTGRLPRRRGGGLPPGSC